MNHISRTFRYLVNLEQVITFKTIVEEGSFRSASEKLNKAQSALSYSIKNLETELNIKLFDRSAYRPQLTMEGKLLYEQSLQILKEVDKFNSLSETLSSGTEAVLHLGVSAPFSLERVTPCLNDFSKQMPNTRLKMTIEVLSTVQRLREGEIDLAISEVQDNELIDFDSLPLMELKLVPVASTSHSLAKIKNKISSSELMAFPHIVLRSTFSSEEKSAGVLSGSTTWSVTDFLTKKRLLLDGAGWGTMPEHLVNEDIKMGKLKRLNTSNYSEVNLKFHLLKRKDQLLGPAAQFLWERIRKECMKTSKNTGKAE